MAAVAAKPAKPAKTAKPALSPRSPKKDIEMEEMSAEEEEKPAEAPEEDWSVEEAMVRKLRVTFQKQSEGAAHANTARNGVRRGNVRVCTQIQIEQRALRALKQNLFAAFNSVI